MIPYAIITLFSLLESLAENLPKWLYKRKKNSEKSLFSKTKVSFTELFS